MKILVPIKQVLDPYGPIQVDTEAAVVVKQQTAKMVINPFDAIALEQALRLKEQAVATEIIVISMGAERVKESLRRGLAMGADRGIFIVAHEDLDPLVIAKALKRVVQQEHIDLVLMGKQAVDDDNNQVPQMLAGLLAWPQATFVSELNITDQSIVVKREVENGLQQLQLTGPAVISTDLRLNEPRYISLPNILQAKGKIITELAWQELAIEPRKKQRITQLIQPEYKRKSHQLTTAAELINQLHHELGLL
jgi:electron transfer flavoprotein beta subunit